MALHLYLIRHGETAWNREGRIQGSTDIGLNEKGLEQAARLGRHISSLCPVRIISSDLSRAMETARPIAETCKIHLESSPLMRELNYGKWEGLTYEGILVSEWAKEWQLFREDRTLNSPPGGESLEELFKRVGRFYKEVVQTSNDGRVVVVGHGGSIRALITTLIQGTPHTWSRFSIENAALSRLELIGEGQWVLKSLNEVFYL